MNDSKSCFKKIITKIKVHEFDKSFLFPYSYESKECYFDIPKVEYLLFPTKMIGYFISILKNYLFKPLNI